MTNEELERLEALANAATAGPWVYDGYNVVEATGPHGKVDVLEMPKDWYEGSEYTGSYSLATGLGADLVFAAAARDAVPELIAEVRRLRGLVEAAYREAYSRGADADEVQREWDHSDARREMLKASSGSSDPRALDADKTPQDGVS